MRATSDSPLRVLPSVSECLHTLASQPETAEIPVKRQTLISRLFLDALRQELSAGKRPALTRELMLAELCRFACEYHRPSLRRVINATGIIVHTNLGRSLLPESSLAALCEAATHYANLELDLNSGKRGLRYTHVEGLIRELTGADAAMVVNNNAAAVLLALDTLARGREVVVSRGELVEIGGAFRIPEIIVRSGAKLVEVGTTNRTRLADYEAAIGPETALLLKVHTSNYRMVGFTEEVDKTELARLAQKNNIPFVEDLGSGCLFDLRRFGLPGEPLVAESIAAGVSLVSFSGDKLLGGPQAGILAGEREIVRQIQKNQLTRALRIDKLTLAALEAVLRLYFDDQTAVTMIPALRMMAESAEHIKMRAERVQKKLAASMSEARCIFELRPLFSQVGGGSLPGQNLPSWGLAVQPGNMAAHELEKSLRSCAVPVLGRMERELLYLDMRTVGIDEEALLITGLKEALNARD